jgi:hypothetical protein
MLLKIIELAWPLAAGTALYLLQAVLYNNRGDWPMTGAFVCYAGANVFFICAALRSAHALH